MAEMLRESKSKYPICQNTAQGSPSSDLTGTQNTLLANHSPRFSKLRSCRKAKHTSTHGCAHTQTFTPEQWEVSQADGSLPHKELTAGPFGVWAAKGASKREKPPQREDGGAAEGIRDPSPLSGPRLTRAQRPRSWPASPVASEATRSRASPSSQAGLNRQGPPTPLGPQHQRETEPGGLAGFRGPRKRRSSRDSRTTPCGPSSWEKTPARTPLPVAERK